MYSKVFIDDFSALGDRLKATLSGSVFDRKFEAALRNSFKGNPLFTLNMQHIALTSICNCFLEKSKLEKWLLDYSDRIEERQGEVLAVMAGNIPLVGFHDFMTILAAGFRAKIKLSSKDSYLLPYILGVLFEIDDYWSDRVEIIDYLPLCADILIASGSDNTASFFENKYPLSKKIIRGSRFSIAVLKGDEDYVALEALAKDVFLYYGLGCRSVSSLFVPCGYDLTLLSVAFATMRSELTSDDYLAAYRYQKAVMTLESKNIVDGNFYILARGGNLPPSMGVVNLFEYDNLDEIKEFVQTNRNRLQCVVNYDSNVSFGQAQFPGIEQYADNLNSLEFLLQFV